MNRKAKILATFVVTGVCVASGSMAGGVQAVDSYETNPLVLKEFDRLYIETPVAADLAVMNVRVFGPGNELLLDARSFGESVEFLATSGLPDGEYRYETVSIFGNVDLRSRETATGGGDMTMLKKFGTFKVVNGEIEGGSSLDKVNLREDASLMDKVIDGAVDLAGLTLDFLIPSAHAVILHEDTVAIKTTAPTIWFNDTQDDSCGSDADWWIIADGGSSTGSTNNSWVLNGVAETASGSCGSAVPIIALNHDGLNGATSAINSLVVDTDGDIHWAQGALNFDKGESGLSIGTAITGAEIVASADDPEIRLRDEAFSDYMFTSYDTFWYNIGYSSTNIARINFSAPLESLVLDGQGNLGIGTGTSIFPAASLEVRRSDGTAAILVDEQSVTSETRNLFTLQNKGLTKFIINNLDGAEWAFANKGTSFRISRQGSGVVEMEVFNNGDVTIQGALTQNSDVNVKTNIQPVDQRTVLERITEMPISQWQYKDALGENHIGPMAQDFYAAFGLGKTDTGLSSIDTAGVALVAIQALADENKALREQVQSQQERLDALENHQVEMQAMVTSLIEAQQAAPVLTKTAMN